MSILDTPSAASKSRPQAALSPRAGILLAFLETSPRTWSELAEIGLDRDSVMLAVGELSRVGNLHIVVAAHGVSLIGGGRR